MIYLRIKWRSPSDEYDRCELWTDLYACKELYHILRRHGYRPKVFNKYGEDITKQDMRGWE